MKVTKSFDIPKQLVFESYEKVKRNKGSAGVDGQTIRDFNKNLKGNLYKIWNRMSSGSYFPPPVLITKIPKGDGKLRSLGIPTVADRIAQMVVKKILEPKLEKVFHEDSCGYRPNKSAIEAIGKARERCWRNDWVVDLDIKGFFDNIDHELMMKAVKHHTNCKWILMYIRRWLKAPALETDGGVVEREKGTPQGGVISPLLANLYLHYAFDMWMKRNHSNIPFERYADDVIIHCKTEKQAELVKNMIERRLRKCKLELHPGKTKIVYCKDSSRKRGYKNIKFDFLSYTFRPRLARNHKGVMFTSFCPAVSNKAKKGLKDKIRSLKIRKKEGLEIKDIAELMNPIVRGWKNYFTCYYKTETRNTLAYLDDVIIRWIKSKYKRFKRSHTRASKWLKEIAKRNPKLFSHWTSETIG